MYYLLEIRQPSGVLGLKGKASRFQA